MSEIDELSKINLSTLADGLIKFNVWLEWMNSKELSKFVRVMELSDQMRLFLAFNKYASEISPTKARP